MARTVVALFSEHGIYQAYKLALYLYTLQAPGTYYSGEEQILLRSKDPDGGFRTGYDQAGTYAGTQENAETTSISIITISAQNLPCTHTLCFIPSIPSWIICMYTGLAVAAVAIVVTILLLDRRKRIQPRGMDHPIGKRGFFPEKNMQHHLRLLFGS